MYFAFYVLPVVLWFLLFRTRHGLNLRAVGENPAAADAVGVNVTGMRFTYATIGAALSGAGGAHLVLGYTQNWSIGVVSGAGWVSLAVVIFAAWRPFLVVLGVAPVRRDDVARLRRPGPATGTCRATCWRCCRTS